MFAVSHVAGYIQFHSAPLDLFARYDPDSLSELLAYGQREVRIRYSFTKILHVR
jgi:hypothetical protein